MHFYNFLTNNIKYIVKIAKYKEFTMQNVETKADGKEESIYEKAIKEAISKGILADYLTRKGDAVVEMLKNQFGDVSGLDDTSPTNNDQENL